MLYKIMFLNRFDEILLNNTIKEIISFKKIARDKNKMSSDYSTQNTQLD